MIVVASTLK